ncbi:cysteine desulfurase [Collibacillus ludicampi]|uniref:Cysteine desulfurase n=1 Tax=Collibacillus ludicampi TaxID=2771369 RepID=A0AAV4LA50_9BACL|nr:cysteine desulfurase family protein [Collibacillus ludicampi]GIM44663.1 cysteine desulfurase [Collibacillus ludicampi]
MSNIYLDNAATTPVHPSVQEAMEPFLSQTFGNPSSIHRYGRLAKQAIEKAREQVAHAIGAEPAEIVFTSGGTEADNSALIGTVLANRDRGKHIVTTAIEHHAILHTCEFLEEMGCTVTYVAPEKDGIVSVERVIEAIREDTVLVSVMYANNETGAIQPVDTIAEICQEREIAFHTDAVQAVPVLPIDVKKEGFTLLSLSGHKLHGPKGVGALYVSRTAKWTPLLRGGSQERNRRAGTENLAAIVGLGVAMERIKENQNRTAQHLQMLRERMIAILREGIQEIIIHTPDCSIPSILSVAFPGVPADITLMNLDLQGVAASSGSACTAGSLEPSHVLLAMGIDPKIVRSSIRFSFSEQNTLEEVTEAARKTVEIINRLRK